MLALCRVGRLCAGQEVIRMFKVYDVYSSKSKQQLRQRSLCASYIIHKDNESTNQVYRAYYWYNNNIKTSSNPNTLCNIKQAGLHKVNIYKSVPAYTIINSTINS